MSKHDGLIGADIGSWHVESRIDSRHLLCRCVCKRKVAVATASLLSGDSSSCGCSIGRAGMGEKMGRHGLRSHPLYRTWARMHERCHNKKHQAYHRYGGRGITVCDRWTGPHGFENFLADMREKPAGTTLERRGNDGNYEPDNCYWATQKQQCRNKINNKLLTHDNKTQCMAAWAEELKVDRYWLKNQLRRRTLTEVIAAM